MERHLFEPEHQMFRDSVRRFFQKEVEPHRDRWHAAGQVDREIFARVASRACC
jgi:alkylation response protein AidB-like acyl-CoA dehydrogenase